MTLFSRTVPLFSYMPKSRLSHVVAQMLMDFMVCFVFVLIVV